MLHRILGKTGTTTADGPLTRRERLMRWAFLLERCPGRLRMLAHEQLQLDLLRDLRINHSPFSVAFADPLLRHDGLDDDTFGRVQDFFGLSDKQICAIVCTRHAEILVAGKDVARIVRRIANFGVSNWWLFWFKVLGPTAIIMDSAKPSHRHKPSYKG